MIAKNQRCHIKNTGEIRPKTKGVIKFSILKILSTNLYDTFEKCVLYACKIRYYHTLKSKGVIGFMTPYDTFTTPFRDNRGHFPALKYSQKGFYMTPFIQKVCHLALQAGLQNIDSAKGVIKSISLVLKGVMKGVVKKYDTLNGLEVMAWQF